MLHVDLEVGEADVPAVGGGADKAPGKRAPTEALPGPWRAPDDRQAPPSAAPEPGAPPPAIALDDVYGLHLLDQRIPAGAAPSRIRAVAGLNVRSSPRVADDNRIGPMYVGDEADVTGKEGAWFQIVWKSARAYVHGHYVEDVAKPRAAAPAPAPVPAPAPAPAPEKPAAPAERIADHSHDQLCKLAIDTGNPQAMALANELRVAEAVYLEARTRQDDHFEQVGKERAGLLAVMASLRQHTKELASAGLDPNTLRTLQGGFYRAIQDLAPYFQQWNENLIGEKTWMYTCNITSLSMTLESIGKTAASYNRDDAKLLVAARALHDKNAERGRLNAMRLPDFMQLAVIARFMESATPAAVGPARKDAKDNITDATFLVKMAGEFGAKAEYFEYTRSKALKTQGQVQAGDTHRRNALMGRARGRKLAGHNDPSNDANDKLTAVAGGEANLPLEAYRDWVLDKIGGELAAGNAIVVGMSGGDGHFARIKAVHDDHIVMDDPGEWHDASLKLGYTEARAMGCFYNGIIVRPG